jgi:hypothetical protein
MAFAHQQLCKAWTQNIVLYTGTGAVENVSVVDTRSAMVDINTINNYRNRLMMTLGVNFLNTESGQTVTTANISINQLIYLINSISEQIEEILEVWYRLVLTEQKIDPEYAPSIRIIDSEMMETKLRIDLAKMLYTTFNCSRETAFDMAGLDLADETAKRKRENAEGLTDIFTPYPIAYTSGNNDDTGGRKPNDEKNDKQDYDTEYNKGRV